MLIMEAVMHTAIATHTAAKVNTVTATPALATGQCTEDFVSVIKGDMALDTDDNKYIS